MRKWRFALKQEKRLAINNPVFEIIFVALFIIETITLTFYFLEKESSWYLVVSVWYLVVG